MTASDRAKQIDEYVRLRDRLSELYWEVTAIDRRLIELERSLPEDYVYPNDLPENWKRKRKRSP